MSERKAPHISRSEAIDRINLAYIGNSSDEELKIIKERIASDRIYNENSVSNEELEIVLNKLSLAVRIEIRG